MSGDQSQRGASWAMLSGLVLLLLSTPIVATPSAEAASARSLATGENHSCAVTRGGAVQCWGANASGQLGNDSASASSTPVDVVGLGAGAVAVGTGRSSSCALTASGGVKCWGDNTYGQLGHGAGPSTLTPVDVTGLTTGVTAMAVGGYHACAVTAAGGVKCWGRNQAGQLGDGTVTDSAVPVDVSGLTSGAAAVALGYYHSCALTSSGAAMCWGYNSYGQLGDGTTTYRRTPLAVQGLASNVASVSSGRNFSCAVTVFGGEMCWGDNSYGQLGDGTTTMRTTPVNVQGLTSGVAAAAGGDYHACAVTSAGGLKCWGWNVAGQLGDGTTTDSLAPIDVSGLTTGVAAIAGGEAHTCALLNDGAVRCWGFNPYGQIGDGTTSQRVTPVGVTGLSGGEGAVAAGVEQVTGGVYHSCAVTRGGGVRCWGYNAYGQLGDGSTTNRFTPVDVQGLTSGVAVVAAGAAFSCALTTAGGVKCWGYNAYGQLGDGTTTTRTTPVDVDGMTSGAVAIAVGHGHACAITMVHTVYCWGLNNLGQLGDETTTNRLIPGIVSGLAFQGEALAVRADFSCALTTGGGVKCWGSNAEGQLGDGTTTNRTAAVTVSGLTSGVATVAAGHSFACAVTTGGGVKCWGDNTYGQLGDGTTTDRLTPVDVSGFTSGARAVAAGYFHACGLTSTGRPHCWGNNSAGALGDGTVMNSPVPANVNDLTAGVRAVSGGYNHTCAVTSRGGLLCWGYNNMGQVGDRTLTNRSVPTWVTGLVDGTGATGAGGLHSCRATSAGGLQCWGRNDQGQLGDGTTVDRLTPFDVSGLPAGVVSVATGSSHTCAVTSGGGVWCWGDNYEGQLGDGTRTDRSTPVSVSGLTSGVVVVVAQSSHTCAVTASGGVKCWGANYRWQLGDGTATRRLTPVWVTGLTSGVTAIALGSIHTCALTTSGGVKCWGDGTLGQLGDGTTGWSYTPEYVMGLTSGAASISATAIHTCALTTGGGVKCWGDNASGQIGDGTTTQRLTPTDVSGMTSGVAAVSAGNDHTCAVTNAGALSCWGNNYNGQLGDGTTTGHATPAPVIGLSSGAGMPVSGTFSTCVVTASGAMKCWGDNAYGHLGDGTTTRRTLPATVRPSKLWHDYDGDLRADIAVYRPAYGTWFWLKSSSSFTEYGYYGWGYLAHGDVPAPGDFDGDGIVDPTVYRPSAGTWFILHSSSNFTTWGWFGWGNATDTLVQGDYDGDGITDAAVHRSSVGTFFVRPSSGIAPWSVNFGLTTDVPVTADYDGDGKTDIAVYRPSTGTWFVLTSTSGFTSTWYRGWGIDALGDVPVPGDYDGDGKTDLCVFRPGTGTWFILLSQGGYTAWRAVGWGTTGDVAVPADFDGDGTTDVAVYRPSNGTWYVRPSNGEPWWSVAFGTTGDVPLLKIR